MSLHLAGMTILVLTTEPAAFADLARELNGAPGLGYAHDLESGVSLLSRSWPLVVVDHGLAGDTTADLVAAAVAAGQRVVVATRRPTLPLTLSVLRAGAIDVLALPLDAQRVRELAAPVSAEAAVEDAASETATASLIGESPALLDAFRTSARAAEADVPVLIVGETGTGKELLARVIHENGARGAAPFVVVNCAAIPAHLLESELFGHEPGALAGTFGRRVGRVQRAQGGTLFLDEIGALAPPLQAKLMRLLQQGVAEAVGAESPQTVDVRLIAATHFDLAEAVAGERFRADLYYALRAVEIVLPPLRERGDDVRLLVQHFLRELSQSYGRDVRQVDAEAMERLQRFTWPSNDDLRIYSTGATFFGPVTTSGTIIDRRYGSFREGYTERAGRIPLPELAELDKLRGQASAGGMAFTGGMTAASGRATTRIEFAARDLNGDGDVSDDHEGFIRVYQSNDTEWLIGANDDNDMRDSETCGHWHADGRFYVADDHPNSGADRWSSALSSGARCFLGGADQIGNGFRANDGRGAWIPRGVAPPPAFSAQPDAGYLFPITRALNPSFKGVIHVTGDVAISGVLRGRVTVAASGDIIIADDITYAINPGVGSCDDILGLFAGGNIVVANTPLNAPWPRSSGSTPITFDDTSDEHIHAFLLTLGIFTVQDYAGGPDREEWCEASRHGRGCLYLTGGIIQRTRGAVGTSGATGYVKRYSYDACGERQPPPYFPTTGKFSRGAYLEVDPTNFDIGAYFGMLTAGGQ